MVEGVEVEMNGGERHLDGGERMMHRGGIMWVEVAGYERELN